ncbi:alpha/beta fold hydrolase [Scytonema sp. UIC 10036]|uniref:alpha/beta hydrolase n=1 Tax=Scytonema sp. UIC 10036 TaxID=2304196 RepID=UPI0012DAC5AC|nr:alpha/beta hydrolase [Scytonema sp. UIC 10036]MUG95764.1 alpha/beta fold hydrolase [Scytonema sp. UIC 10036]
MNNLCGHWTSALRKNSLPLVLSALLPTFGSGNSAFAAERIHASYSAFERSISIPALENYAKTGAIDNDLDAYKQYLKKGQLQQLRRALLTPIKVSHVAISQFLYTSQGEFLLNRLGEVIKTESRQPKAGLHALRSALILAAAEPNGLTLLNILRKYPSRSMHIDLARTMSMASELEKLVNQTKRAVAAVEEKSSLEAASSKLPFHISLRQDLRRRGQYRGQKQTLKFFDATRNRFLLTDIYLPNAQSRVPVIVVSHGLGSDSSNFAYVATHLASHGFAVIVPNHPGSDTKQLRLLLNGKTNEVAPPNEFQNRPLDIKYILDQLEERNKFDSRYRGRLNLQQVGVFGHSFGGYTALALAGAKINFEQLAKDCRENAIKDTWNLSLLLQCNALELRESDAAKQPLRERKIYNFRDKRVKAVVAVNPITSSIFGETGLSQIQTPVLIAASSDDTIAPALYEQILPFSWINNSQKYLAVISKTSHFSAIGEGKGSANQFALPSELVGEDPSLARRYLNVLSLPFFATYVAEMPKYNTFLNAAYVKAISRQSVSLSFVQSLTTNELARGFKK